MARKRKQEKPADRSVVRKGDQVIAKLRNEFDRRDFERRLKAKCNEVGLPVPPLISHGTGETVTLVCKSRDQAIFLLDFAEEALAEMPE
ncbi:hypothetical protein AMJ85_06130 [candidate division BRC1 bacterium SM23_51]|nr:MAG: hypothetical protein AMJ85_06130 [candidate division BRC1 bacterium SM23_51]